MAIAILLGACASAPTSTSLLESARSDYAQAQRNPNVNNFAPLEMKRDDLALLQRERPAGLQTEVFAYGRLPLAYSARCFTARHYNQPKDDCRFSCMEHPEGLPLRTREKEGFLVLNGTQTQSARVYTLIEELPQMQALGVDLVRLSPQPQHMEQVIALFDEVRRQPANAAHAQNRILALMPDWPCNGFWHGRAGVEQYVAA